MPDDATGRLVVKFLDDVKARADKGRVQSLSNRPMDDVNEVLRHFGLTAKPAFTQDDETIDFIERRAADMSRRAQPDLRGMMIIEGPRENLVPAAKLLNELGTEYVTFETQRYVGFGGIGACCFPSGACQIRSEAQCVAAGGVYLGDGTNCSGDPCGDDPIGACCLPDQTCVNQTNNGCIVLGGFWFADTDCAASSMSCRIRVCCIGDEDCQLLREDQCDAASGVWYEDESDCEDFDCMNDCGQVPQDCFDPEGHPAPFCDVEDCCNLVCSILAYCCEEPDLGGVWDFLCAANANLLCDIDDGANRCLSPLTGNCFEVHPNGGCNNPQCCTDVCDIAGFCCENSWSAVCVSLANAVCGPSTPGGPTPDFTSFQGYRSADPWPDPLPPELAPYIPIVGGMPFYGFTGEGLDLRTEGEAFDDDGYDLSPSTGDPGEGNQWRDPDEPFSDYGLDGLPGTADSGELNGVFDAGEPFDDLNGDGSWSTGENFTDDNGNEVWDPPGGLWGFAELLLRGGGDNIPLTEDDNADATGQGNLTTGRGAKIGVVEWAYYEGHEDLVVRTEPGVRLIINPSITEPDHATACLSIINGKDNGIGVTGIVPDADGYFFALTSIDEGPRELAAWLGAIGTLGPGDVVSASYGPGPPIGCLNNDQALWTLFRLASDSGITVCVAAGNSCYNLDGAPDLGDSGAVVVGACSPGFPWWRLAFSNYCTAPDQARSNVVHMKSWGTLACAAGYGDLWLPNGNKKRSYTGSFGGTSAASPQMAGVICALQGLAKQVYGIPLMPEQIRSVLIGWCNGGFPPDADWFGAFDDTEGCTIDLDPEMGPNCTGGYPNLVAGFGSAASTILNQQFPGFNDAPLVDDVVIVRGTNVQGNKFSIKGSDNNYLKLEAELTQRNFRPGEDMIEGAGGGTDPAAIVPQVRELTYLAGGLMTDIVVVATSDVTPVNTLIVRIEQRWPAVPAIMLVEAYDWRAHRWSFVDILVDAAQANPTDVDLTFDATATSPNRFVNAVDQKILVRIWEIGFPTPAGADGSDGGTWMSRFDLIHVFASDLPGQQIP